jgi:probable rRNA maturation factor
MAFRIQIRNKQRRFRIFRGPAADFCSRALHEVGKSGFALSVAFVGLNEMREINQRYLERNYPTDVLSFSYREELPDGDPLLGEILVSPEAAQKNAQSNGVSLDREIKRLLIHGILHLSGYNHEDDDGTMSRLQANLMRRTFVKNAGAVVENVKSSA